MKSDLPSDVLEAVHANRKIDAIKLLRKHRKLGLKEAKHIIDAYAAENPHLIVSRRSGEDSGFGRFLIAGAIITVVYGVYRVFS